MRPGVEIATPPEVMDATIADVSIETEVAFNAAHSSPFAYVPVWTMAIEPGAGDVWRLPASAAEKSSQSPPWVPLV
jgi:hypothetical protein